MQFTSLTTALFVAAAFCTGANAISCFDQAYPSRTPLCVKLPARCPSGYRSVFWDTGCPASNWRCCV
ncbi:hypothetical protein BKA70DRAFT_1265939 [Coprinopsis sp. MPI-PUGE-AT-0042]|nr:hypothetical protein BKA70DRAFT_1265939 [Coprinopsis sp. MPI-PUGE-AT-0042]